MALQVLAWMKGEENMNEEKRQLETIESHLIYGV